MTPTSTFPRFGVPGHAGGIQDPDWLRVSLRSDALVRISHETSTGPGDALERPRAELLPLFWRVAILKWGVHPDRDLK